MNATTFLTPGLKNASITVGMATAELHLADQRYIKDASELNKVALQNAWDRLYAAQDHMNSVALQLAIRDLDHE